MAFAATTILETQTGGSDTANGGAFNPGNANMATDLTATSATSSAPVCSSASYNFQARDVGNWLFIKSGTNWTPGWYQISSVAANAATINGTAAAWVSYSNQIIPGTTTGCATTASPTGGTWSVDYSQSTGGIAYTDLVAATTTTFTSVAKPVGKNMVGNIVSITSGTGWNVARWEVSSVSTITGTASNFSTGSTIATALSTGGTGSLGGALKSPAVAVGLNTDGNYIFSATGTYTMSSGTSNVANGRLAFGNASLTTFTRLIGYRAVRGDLNGVNAPAAGFRPKLQASSLSGVTMVSMGTGHHIENFEVDGQSGTSTSMTGVACNNVGNVVLRVLSSNMPGNAFVDNAVSNYFYFCEATGGNSQAFLTCKYCVGCNAHDNTAIGILALICVNCISESNSGGGSNGFSAPSGSQVLWINCTAYNNGNYGFHCQSNSSVVIMNSVAVNNAAYGFATNGGNGVSYSLLNCAGYNNTSGNIGTGTDAPGVNENFATLTGSPFTDAANGDFSLNNTAGAGTACRGMGTPGIFPGGTSTGYADIGAIQHQDSGGGSGGVTVPTFRFGPESLQIG